ncbi:MAG: hypothetical protein IKG23_11290 [Clostridia bacterium]|nr:hypothetical protein [Clostridia bacterium]
MKSYRYVLLDPTGNITALVLDPADPYDERRITRELLKRSEQVAYLEAPKNPGAVAAIRLMGGEFCGNAAMASAAWLIREKAEQNKPKALLLEVSGAADPVCCTVLKTADGFEGTVEMPGTPEIGTEKIGDVLFTAVRMEGITHLICEGRNFKKEEAESLLRQIADRLSDEAIGLIQWDRVKQYMLPLVFVRGSNSMVWEHGCGSGSAAVGVAEALRNGAGETTTEVKQPGGTIRVTAAAENGEIVSVRISGRVKPGKETIIEIP